MATKYEENAKVKASEFKDTEDEVNGGLCGILGTTKRTASLSAAAAAPP